MKHLKTLTYVVLAAVLFVSCEKETETLIDNSNTLNDDQIENLPLLGNKIIAVKNSNNKITGYYYENNSDEIFSIEKTKTFSNTSAQSNEIISLVGDEDNFGYGGSDTPSCSFYDFSDPITDLGIFDREYSDTSDNIESWTHDFTNSIDNGFIADEVVIEIREYFSDNENSTITIDGNSYSFTINGFSACNFPVIQTFTFTGQAASFANDGIINITFNENGDDIGLDYSKVTIKGPLSPDIDDDGVLNQDDNCPETPNADQADMDEDGQGDVCDDDIDGDDILNEDDNCPENANPNQEDYDYDGMGDACDDDDDNDGVIDTKDNHPFSSMYRSIVIDNCWPDIENMMVKRGTNMQDEINDVIDLVNAMEDVSDSRRTNRFKSKMYFIVNNWRYKYRLIDNREKRTILDCVNNASYPFNEDID